MSRANSTFALIVASSAPCTNGTASAKARNESVGKPGRRVAALNPPALTASRSIGKTSGKMTFAGCRAVRITARRPSVATCGRATAVTACSGARRPSRAYGLGCGLGLRLGVLLRFARALEMAARLREEDVVERRLVDLELGQHDALGVERTDDLGEIAVRGAQLHRDAALPEARRLVSEPLEHLGHGPALARVRGHGLDGRARDLGLETLRRSLGDDPA